MSKLKITFDHKAAWRLANPIAPPEGRPFLEVQQEAIYWALIDKHEAELSAIHDLLSDLLESLGKAPLSPRDSE